MSKKQAVPETDIPKDNNAGSSSSAKDGLDVEEKKENAVMDVDDDEAVSCFNMIRHF